MKVVNTILKILVALAAVAGIIYVVANYGDKIVAWAKKMLGKCSCLCGCDCECEECDCACDGDCDDCQCEYDCEESCPCDAVVDEDTEEAVVEEVLAEEAAVVAEDADFEG